MSQRTNKVFSPNPCSGCGVLHWFEDCTFRNKKCSICNRVGHKSSHCRSKNKIISSIEDRRLDEPDNANARKFVHVEMLNKSVKLQLDSGSDLTIINLQTWKKLGRPTMIKFARSVTGEKIKFKWGLITNAAFNGKTLKLTSFVLRNTNNLFGTDWMTQFQLWDLPVNSYCPKIENFNTESEKQKKNLRQPILNFFLVVY